MEIQHGRFLGFTGTIKYGAWVKKIGAGLISWPGLQSCLSFRNFI
jgi:hypothetical protein